MTKKEDQALRDLAEKCAGIAPGEKTGRWTHEDRVAICYWVCKTLIKLNEIKRKNMSIQEKAKRFNKIPAPIDLEADPFNDQEHNELLDEKLKYNDRQE